MSKIKYIIPFILLPTSLMAQESPKNWSIGLVGMQSSGEYVNQNSNASILPYIRFESETISIGMPDGITWRAYNHHDFEINGFIKPRFHGLSDSNLLDRDLTGDLGISLKYDLVRGTSIKSSIQREVTGEHDGFELDASISQFIPPIVGVPIIASAGIKWMDDNLSNYMYGVGSSDIGSGFATYNTDDNFIPYVSLTSFYSVTDDVSLFGTFNYKMLSNEIIDSPLVKDDVDSYNIIIGLGYSF